MQERGCKILRLDWGLILHFSTPPFLHPFPSVPPNSFAYLASSALPRYLLTKNRCKVKGRLGT